MILSDRVCDGEAIRVTFDSPRHRLAITPNHEGVGVGADMEDYIYDVEAEGMGWNRCLRVRTLQQVRIYPFVK
jgi:hypothetical protein